MVGFIGWVDLGVEVNCSDRIIVWVQKVSWGSG